MIYYFMQINIFLNKSIISHFEVRSLLDQNMLKYIKNKHFACSYAACDIIILVFYSVIIIS